MNKALLACVLFSLGLPGCRASSAKLSAQNDELRRSNMDLQRAVEDLSQQLAQREQELATTRMAQGDGPVDGVQPRRLAGIELDRLTGVLPPSAQSQSLDLRVYLRPVDQDGRVITATGQARVRLLQFPDRGEPVTVIDVTYDAQQLHDAYRDGLTGTHYTFKAQLPLDVFEHGGVMLRVALTDAATGHVYTAERVVTMR